MKTISFRPNLQERSRKDETVICVSFKYKETEIREDHNVCPEPVICVHKKDSHHKITRKNEEKNTYKSLERSTTPGESKGGLIINYWVKRIVVVVLSDPLFKEGMSDSQW